VPQIDVIDETFIVAPGAAVSAIVHDAARWREWWPDLHLAVLTDRHDAGIRWTVSGGQVGSMEVWIEPTGDGATLHYYLRIEPAGRTLRRRAARRAVRRRIIATKRVCWAIKDELEAGRAIGEPRRGASGSSNSR